MPFDTFPRIGDTIFVPSFEAKPNSSCWYDREKKGGIAKIENIQYPNEKDCCIFTQEYSAFSVWWSEICDIQAELEEEFGSIDRARIL